MYTQNQEEKFITEYFEEKYGNGSGPHLLLSIGENDGKTFSNSLRLIELGWDAVLVEPSPGAFAKMQELHKGRPNNIVLCKAALSDKDGPQEFFESGTHLKAGDTALLSTLKESELDRWKGTDNEFQKITVEGMTWTSFLKWLNLGEEEHFKFISIDAEGVDLIILKQIDLTLTDMVCIEWNGDQEVKQEALDYCSSFGLSNIIYTSGENLIIAR